MHLHPPFDNKRKLIFHPCGYHVWALWTIGRQVYILKFHEARTSTVTGAVVTRAVKITNAKHARCSDL